MLYPCFIYAFNMDLE